MHTTSCCMDEKVPASQRRGPVRLRQRKRGIRNTICHLQNTHHFSHRRAESRSCKQAKRGSSSQPSPKPGTKAGWGLPFEAICTTCLAAHMRREPSRHWLFSWFIPILSVPSHRNTASPDIPVCGCLGFGLDVGCYTKKVSWKVAKRSGLIYIISLLFLHTLHSIL